MKMTCLTKYQLNLKFKFQTYVFFVIDELKYMLLNCVIGVLLEVSRDVGLEVNAETKYMLSRDQNAEQNHNLLIAIEYFESVAQFKHMVNL